MACIGGLLNTATGSVILIASEVKEVESYIDQLNAENAELREENARLRSCLSDDAENTRQIMAESARLREYAAKAWSLFIRHGAVHPYDLSEVDAVRDGLRELGVKEDA